MQNTLTSLEDKQLWITYSQGTNRLSTGYPICNIANLMPEGREKLVNHVIHMLSNFSCDYKRFTNGDIFVLSMFARRVRLVQGVCT